MKRVDKAVTLPNGVVLSKGTIFEVAIQPADFRDPRLRQPDEWDGFRFHQMRRTEGFSDKSAREYEWGTSTRDDIDFGYGMHYCPGNAVGCNMLKIFLTKLLEMYYLEPEEGAPERYKDVHLGQYVSSLVMLARLKDMILTLSRLSQISPRLS
jgi:cytochrome P450